MSRIAVDHVTAQDGANMQHSGPVIMAWANSNDIAEFVKHNSGKIRALCVIPRDMTGLSLWVSMAKPELINEASERTSLTPTLPSVVVEDDGSPDQKNQPH